MVAYTLNVYAKGRCSMSKQRYGSVLTCGACSVIMSGEGNTQTSIDKLVKGLKHFFIPTDN